MIFSVGVDYNFRKICKKLLILLKTDWITTGTRFTRSVITERHDSFQNVICQIFSTTGRPKPTADLRADYITHNNQTLHFLFQRTDQTHLICQSNHKQHDTNLWPGCSGRSSAPRTAAARLSLCVLTANTAWLSLSACQTPLCPSQTVTFQATTPQTRMQWRDNERTEAK